MEWYLIPLVIILLLAASACHYEKKKDNLKVKHLVLWAFVIVTPVLNLVAAVALLVSVAIDIFRKVITSELWNKKL